MKAAQLKKKYPNYWETVYENVLDDLNAMDYGIRREGCKKAIAYNAAFEATYLFHKCNLKNDMVDKIKKILMKKELVKIGGVKDVYGTFQKMRDIKITLGIK